MKKYIPNILTTYRLIIALLIPLLLIYNKYNLLVILFIIAIISDLLDGYLARKWNVTSLYGKVVDMIGDKSLALISSASFALLTSKWFIITLIFEIIILIINSINYLKTKDINKHESSIYGKIKTWFLFISLLIGLISYKIGVLSNLILPFILITMIMQIMTAYNYLNNKY